MLPPIRKTIVVPWDQAAAFTRFTEGIGAWWPLASHSVGRDRAETVVFEGRVGGHIIEKIRGGAEAVWGTVTAWDPPRRAAWTWHPGAPPERATHVEVSFAPASGGTELVLLHSNWENLGRMAKRARSGYPIGWTWVLAQYADRRNRPHILAIQFMGWLMSPLARRMSERARREWDAEIAAP